MLDMRTILFSYVITDVVSTLVMVFLWLQNRKRFAGTGFWTLDFAFQTIALVLIASRGALPDFYSMLLSNTLVIVGALFGLVALQRFLGIKSRHFHNYFLIAVFASIHAWFTFVNPNLAARNLNISVALLLVFFQCAWLLLVSSPNRSRRITAAVGAVFAAYSLINLVRIGWFFVQDSVEMDYLHSGGIEPFVLLLYQTLFVILTCSLALMYNKQLLADISSQEEKFSKAFHSSPYAVMLTRLSDGKIFEVNDGFLQITGYDYSEVLGKTTLELNIWVKEEDRLIVVDELTKYSKIKEREFQFQIKSGEIITGLMSSEIIRVNNDNTIISCINDISDRKKTEASLKKSEATLMAAMDCSQAGIAIADAPSGLLRYVNKAGLMIPDKSESEVVTGIDLQKYVSSWQMKSTDGSWLKPEEVPLARAIMFGETNSREFVICRENHDDRTVWANAAPILDEHGNVQAGIVVFLDITERKKMELRLESKLSELERFNKLMTGRENRMIELKAEINSLRAQLNLAPRYSSPDEVSPDTQKIKED
jgi:PAS domain S-box-containing protein